jgi:hypothetical protein
MNIDNSFFLNKKKGSNNLEVSFSNGQNTKTMYFHKVMKFLNNFKS